MNIVPRSHAIQLYELQCIYTCQNCYKFFVKSWCWLLNRDAIILPLLHWNSYCIKYAALCWSLTNVMQFRSLTLHSITSIDLMFLLILATNIHHLLQVLLLLSTHLSTDRLSSNCYESRFWSVFVSLASLLLCLPQQAWPFLISLFGSVVSF